MLYFEFRKALYMLKLCKIHINPVLEQIVRHTVADGRMPVCVGVAVADAVRLLWL